MADFLIVFGISIVIVIAIVALVKRKGNQEMDRKKLNSGADAMITALHIEGIGLQNKASCDMYLFSDKIMIEHYGQKFEIPLDRMRAAEIKNEQEIYEKSKSVVGRALIGTLLVPGIGTIVGGMSGIGNKKTKGMPNTYLILNFISSNGELSGVTFLNNFDITRINKFCAAVNSQIRNNNSETKVL